MVNICFILLDFSVYGGIERVTCNLSNALKKKYNIHIVTICNENKQPIVDFTKEKNIKYYQMGLSNIRIRNLCMKSFFPLIHYLKNNKIDVAFLMGHVVVPIAILAKFFTHTKMIFCDHSSLDVHKYDKVATLYRRIGSQCSNKTIVLTKYNLEDYKKTFHTNPSKIDYIYNFIDDKVFEEVSKNYDVTSKKIVTVGRISKEKGFDMLVEVAKLVFKEHQNWQWDIYGDGEEFDNIKKQIEENGLQNNVILKGKTNEIYKKYKEYSMYVLPSYREGLPLVLLEAKANKLPIVSFDVVTGPREIVRDNVDGFLIPCYNKKLMAKKIIELIEEKELRLKFSNNSQHNINKFSKEEIMKKWIDLIENI